MTTTLSRFSSNGFAENIILNTTEVRMLSEEGARLRDDGIQRSAAHADAIVPDWGDMAFKAAIRYCRHMKGNTFTADQLRAWAERYNFPNPPDKRAWGAVFRKLSSKGHITVAGYVPSNDPKQHCAPSTLWRAT